VFHLWQMNFASYEESTGSPMRGILFASMFSPIDTILESVVQIALAEMTLKIAEDHVM